MPAFTFMPHDAGKRLRALRERLGLTLKDVEAASSALAARHDNADFSIPVSRLSDIETREMLPSVHRLYTLSVLYRHDFKALCGWYGVPLDASVADSELMQIRVTHPCSSVENVETALAPVEMDPGFDIRRTTNFSRMIQKWGTVPLAFVARFDDKRYVYAYLGTEDYTMYPLLLPGCFLQVDDHSLEIVNDGWRSEYERPIYFLETRDGFICAWCSRIDRERIMIQPHPLSPVAPNMMACPQEAEVLGRVVGIAMRLDGLSFREPAPAGPAPARLN
jgi:transcriptional regulator with XRE-family HTH domain